MIKRRVKEHGLTVFFTTHIMEEAEYLCDKVAVINKGKVVAIESPRMLKEKFGGLQTLEAMVEGGDQAGLVKELRVVDGVSEVAASVSGMITVTTSSPGETLKVIGNLSEKMGFRIVQLNLREPTLEQAFVSLVTEK